MATFPGTYVTSLYTRPPFSSILVVLRVEILSSPGLSMVQALAAT